MLRVSAAAPGPEHDGATWQTAFTTLQAALDRAVADDEIWVARGIYTGNFILTNGIGLYGGFTGTEDTREQRDWAANETVLDGGHAGSVVRMLQGTPPGYSNSVLDGFTVRNGSGTPTTSAGTVGGGIYIDAYAWARVRHNRIMDNAATLDGGGVAAHLDSRMYLQDNFIAGNRADRNGGGVYSESASPPSDIGGNTIARNTAAQGGGMSLRQTYYWSFISRVANNIVAFNSSGVMYQSSIPGSSIPPTLTACDVYGNTAYDYSGWSYPVTGTRGNISADPLFVDAENGDYHLRPDSPCRDAGDGVYVSPEDRDIDGQRRLFGANPDIGADEIPTSGVPVDIPLVYVSTSGDDANDGATWATAKRHVYAALDVVRSPGGEVWVAAGKYTESVIVWPGVALYGGFAGTETTREARDPAANITVLDGSSGTRSSVAILARDNVMSGFTVTGGIGGIAAIHPGGTSRIEGNVITNNTGTGIGVGGGSFVIRGNVISGNQQAIYGRIADVRIERNRIYGNQGRPGGILLSRCDARLSDNLVYGNVGGGVRLSETTGSITNNTIVRNFGCHRYADGIAEYPIAGGVSSDASSMTLVNNIIAFNTGGVLENAPTSAPALRNNCVYGNEWYDWQLSDGGDPAGSNGNIAKDPQLAELATGNAHIQPASPCRDAGDTSVTEAGETDMDGQPRIQGPSVDIGADESDGTVWAPRACIVRVSTTGSDEADGSSWAQAMKTVQAAIDRAAPTGGEVWVAAGTYIGSFTLPAYVRLYGGFDGTEEEREARNPQQNPTVLDGNGIGPLLVVEAMGLFTAVDGFTVQNGKASIPTFAVGGLACLRGSSVQIVNNRFTGNSGGIVSTIRVDGAWADIRRNVITGNGRPNAYTVGSVLLSSMIGAFEENTVSSNISGGGLRLASSSALIRRNTITGNKDSGGIDSSGSSCDITQNVIRDNTGDGGGMRLFGYDRVVSNLIAGNTGQWGGGIQLQSQGTTVTNNTIVGNTALYNAGGVYVSGFNAHVYNNIIAFNNSGLYCTDAALPEGYRHVITHNDLFGNTENNSQNLAPEYGAALNFSEDPLFVNRGAGDYHLLPGSPCIDRGDSQYVRPGDLDIDGQARILGAAVDVGADEFLANGPSMADVVRALRLAGGLDAATTEDWRLDSGVAGAVVIDLSDALRLARRRAGLDNGG